MTAIDASGEQRAALARELQWLASILPLGNGNERYDACQRRSCRGHRRDRVARAAVARRPTRRSAGAGGGRPAARRRPRLLLRAGRERGSAGADPRMARRPPARHEEPAPVRAHAAGDPAAAVPGEPAPRRNGAGAAHAPVSGHARRAAGRARGRSRAGADAGGGGRRADRHRRLRRRRRLDLGAGRHRSAADGGAGRGPHGRAQARRRRAAGGRGPLPGDVRRLAAGHLPGRRRTATAST